MFIEDSMNRKKHKEELIDISNQVFGKLNQIIDKI